ncbi:AAA family ATPase [Streptomyces johnsoniae]|uniref:AAA family ATPase n=1 Tax=Streptomyces johnsoniae TaxID=3075532 RepID=A0ABU2S3F4_9ACTN|nr:AAA family ATPase [Streptomyces sp. DSM 41886]MDT0442349.1 AAA family ATPase [Streptomyces sp. DSM 41886]
MRTLSRSVIRGGEPSAPLPAPFQTWAQQRIRFHRASLSLLFGVSGSFKTMIALNALVNMKLPTLAFSTDSDENTVAARLAALSTGEPYEVTRSWRQRDPERLQRAVAPFDFIRWDFVPQLTMDHIWLSLFAYHEIEGRYPDQILVDILSDVWHSEGEGEWGMQKAVLRQLKALARETGCHVLVVTHATADRAKSPCPRKGDVQGKLDLLPEVIISCGVDWQNNLQVTAVKNRHGKSDPQADSHFRMAIEPERAFVGDYIAPQYLSYANAYYDNEEEE